MEFSSILHLITTAVAAKLTYTLNERLDQMASREQGRGSSSFTQQMLGRRVGESRTVLESARTSHSSAVQTHSDASDSLYEGQASGLPQSDLQKLEDAVTAAEQAVTDAAIKLANAADAHQKSILAALPAAQQAKIQKSADLVSSTQAAQQKSQSQSDAANQAYIAEKKNPTGQDLGNLHDAMKHYRRELKVAASAASKASEAHEELTSAITEQIEKTTATSSKGRASWLERLLPGPTDSNREQLAASLAAHQKSAKEHEAANAAYRAAQKAYAGEVANPSGKNLAVLQATMDALKVKRDAATANSQQSADSHLKTQMEVDRQTKWQTARQSIGDWMNPGKKLQKLGQAGRILKKKWDRWKGASSKHRSVQGALKGAQSAYQDALAKHHKNRTVFRDAMTARRAAQKTGHAGNIASTTKTATTAAQAMSKSGGVLGSAKGAMNIAAVAVATARAGQIAAALGSLGAMLGPAGLAIGAAVAAVAAAVVFATGFASRQVRAAESVINGQIRGHADYNGRIAGQIAQYDMNQMRLNMRTGSQTSASSQGVVRSTMQLQNEMQPKNARWENISNRFTTLFNNGAIQLNRLVNMVDFWTPMIEGTAAAAESVEGGWNYVMESLGIISKNTKKEFDPKDSVAVSVLRAAAIANQEARQRRIHPPIPPVR